MKFPYAVKYNGYIYPANTEIEEIKPEPLKTPVTEEKPKAKKAVKGDK